MSTTPRDVNRGPRLLAAALLALTLLGGACKSADDGAPKAGASAAAAPATAETVRGACDRREREKVCSEYYGKLAKPEWIKGECAAQNAPLLTGACPKDGAVGRCSRGVGTGNRTDTVFYAPMTTDTVTAMCADGQVGAL